MNSQLLDWAERWRAVRGSPPGPPPDAGFDFLRELPQAQITALAEEVNEDAERLLWWKDISADPARPILARLRPLQTAVYRHLRNEGPMTDEQLAAMMSKSIRAVVPRRNDLMKSGIVKAVDRARQPNGRHVTIWGLVPAGQIEMERSEAAKRGLRNKNVDKYPPNWRAQLVQHCVRDDEVNQILLEDMRSTKSAERARREARWARQEDDRKRRDYTERVRQAERDASPDLNFLKAMTKVRRAVDSVREMGRVLDEEIQIARTTTGPIDISPAQWAEGREQLKELIALAHDIDDHLAQAIDGDDTVDADLFDDNRGWELPAPRV